MVGVTSSYQQVVIPSMTANTPAQIVGPTGGRIYITGISIDVPASATVTISQGLASDALTALLPIPGDMLTPANATEFAYYAVSARGNGLWITSTQNVSTPTVIQFYSDELISALPTTATPTLNAPSSGYMGETVTVSITNLASYAAGTTIGVNAAGEYAIAGANISWRLPGGATTRSLSVTAQEPGKKLSLAASVSLTVNTYGYPQTVPPTGGGNINPPLTPTTTPTLSVSTLTGQVGSNQNLTITNFDAEFTYNVSVTGGSFIRSNGSISWTLPGDAGSATLSVTATETGKAPSVAATCVATVTTVPATTTPTLGAPSASSVNAGQSVTIQITNWGSYSAPQVAFTKFNAADSVTVDGSGLITWVPATVADNQTLGVQATDPPNSISATAASGEVDVAAAPTTTAAPILSGFLSSVNEGTTNNGTMAKTGGGSYAGGTSYEFRTSNNGGSTWSSWGAVTGATAVRVTGTAVAWDIPNTAGDAATQHRLEIRATEPGSTVSASSNTVSTTGLAVIVPPITDTLALYSYDAPNSHDANTLFGVNSASRVRDLTNNAYDVKQHRKDAQPLVVPGEGFQFPANRICRLESMGSNLAGVTTSVDGITAIYNDGAGTRDFARNVNGFTFWAMVKIDVSTLTDRILYLVSTRTSTTNFRAGLVVANTSSTSSINRLKSFITTSDGTSTSVNHASATNPFSGGGWYSIVQTWDGSLASNNQKIIIRNAAGTELTITLTEDNAAFANTPAHMIFIGSQLLGGATPQPLVGTLRAWGFANRTVLGNSTDEAALISWCEARRVA